MSEISLIKKLENEVKELKKLLTSSKEALEEVIKHNDILKQAYKEVDDHNQDLIYKHNDNVADFNRIREKLLDERKEHEDEINKLKDYIKELEDANIEYSQLLESYGINYTQEIDIPPSLNLTRFNEIKNCFNCKKSQRDPKTDERKCKNSLCEEYNIDNLFNCCDEWQ